MPLDRKRRHVIPLHAEEAGTSRSGEVSSADGSWDPSRIVDEAPRHLRPLVLDLLGAMGVDGSVVANIRRTLGESETLRREPEHMGAAITVVRSAVEHAASRGASAGVTRSRHDCLDAACLAWAEDALESRAVAQRRLLRDVSHDIRSPLNSILFLADALRSRHSGELNPVQGRQVDVLFMAAVTLVKLVNDLIDFSHLQGDSEVSVAAAPFSVEAVVEDVQSLVGPLLAYHEVDFEVHRTETNPRTGDAQILNRVLLNLVSNAAQVLPDGGTVRLDVWDGPDGTLEASVTDSGADADIERIRNALRGALTDESFAETRGWTHGLGLSISARLVAAAGGTLHVEPTESKGACLRVSLPFAAL